MEIKFNFKSQVCTSREQSERLLALGLKKETADCHWFYTGELFGWQSSTQSYMEAIECASGTNWTEDGSIIPAWSLHRLLSLIPKNIEFQVSPMYGRNYTLPIELQITCELDICYIEPNREEFKAFYGTDVYDSAIRCIEWLIKGGYFPKEYLE